MDYDHNGECNYIFVGQCNLFFANGKLVIGKC